MDNKTRNRLRKISIFSLLIAGLIFLGLNIFGGNRSDLIIGLCLITLANVYSTRLKSKE